MASVAREVLAVGFRAHMGWADAVTLSVTADGMDVVDRRTVELRAEGGAVFAYHAAREALPEERDQVIAEAMESARSAAVDAVADLMGELGFRAVGVVVSRGIKYVPLDKILATPQALHAAEGAVYQHALRGAATDVGLPCITIGFPQAENHEIWMAVSALGKHVGPPWKKDQKLAAVAAYVAAQALPASPFCH